MDGEPPQIDPVELKPREHPVVTIPVDAFVKQFLEVNKKIRMEHTRVTEVRDDSGYVADRLSTQDEYLTGYDTINTQARSFASFISSLPQVTAGIYPGVEVTLLREDEEHPEGKELPFSYQSDSMKNTFHIFISGEEVVYDEDLAQGPPEDISKLAAYQEKLRDQQFRLGQFELLMHDALDQATHIRIKAFQEPTEPNPPAQA